jgi:hypothetical protein
MRRWIAILTLAALFLALAAPGAQAGSTAAKVALGLASFAVFNQLVGPFIYPRPVYAYAPAYVVAPPAVVYAPPAVVSVSPPTVVQYPHGRYELRVEGGRYVWVWTPNPPPPPAYQVPASPPPPSSGAEAAPAPGACKPTGKYVKTPQGLLPECE